MTEVRSKQRFVGKAFTLEWVYCIYSAYKLHVVYIYITFTFTKKQFNLHHSSCVLCTTYKRCLSSPIPHILTCAHVYAQWMLLALPAWLPMYVCMHTRRFGQTERVLCDWFNYWRVKCNFAQIQMPFYKHACGLRTTNTLIVRYIQ